MHQTIFRCSYSGTSERRAWSRSSRRQLTSSPIRVVAIARLIRLAQFRRRRRSRWSSPPRARRSQAMSGRRVSGNHGFRRRRSSRRALRRAEVHRVRAPGTVASAVTRPAYAYEPPSLMGRGPMGSQTSPSMADGRCRHCRSFDREESRADVRRWSCIRRPGSRVPRRRSRPAHDVRSNHHCALFEGLSSSRPHSRRRRVGTLPVAARERERRR